MLTVLNRAFCFRESNKGLDKGTWIASYQNKFDKVSQIILAS